MNLTESLVREIQERAEKATPGVWVVDANNYRCEVHGPEHFFVCELRGWGQLTGTGGMDLPPEEAAEIQDANARLIAESRTSVPKLAEDWLEQNERIKELHAALKEKDKLIQELRAFIEKPSRLAHVNADGWECVVESMPCGPNCPACKYKADRAALLERSQPQE